MTAAHQFAGRSWKQRLARGVTPERVEAVLRRLWRRFGPLSDAVVHRIRRASSGELDAMEFRSLTAETLEQAMARKHELTDDDHVDQIRTFIYLGEVEAAYQVLVANFHLIGRVWCSRVLDPAPVQYPLDGVLWWDDNTAEWERLLKRRVL